MTYQLDPGLMREARNARWRVNLFKNCMMGFFADGSLASVGEVFPGLEACGFDLTPPTKEDRDQLEEALRKTGLFT